MRVQVIFRQGSGVPPDSSKTVLRSGVVRKLHGNCRSGGTSAEKPTPAEIIFYDVRYWI
jgi:hypothetical protein